MQQNPKNPVSFLVVKESPLLKKERMCARMIPVLPYVIDSNYFFKSITQSTKKQKTGTTLVPVFLERDFIPLSHSSRGFSAYPHRAPIRSLCSTRRVGALLPRGMD